MTVILLTCSYDGREFVRVGYYVNNEYTDEALNAEPPAKPVIEKVRRNILAEKPRVTRFSIKWDSEESAPAEFPPEQPDADQAEDDEAKYGAEDEEEVEEEAVDEVAAPKVEGDDAAMAGAEEANGHVKEEDEASDAGSEDLEAESSGEDDEDEDEEDEEGEGEGEGEQDGEGAAGEDTEMKEGAPVPVVPIAEESKQQQPDVMVH